MYNKYVSMKKIFNVLVLSSRGKIVQEFKDKSLLQLAREIREDKGLLVY